jgi:hypothetical protein
MISLIRVFQELRFALAIAVAVSICCSGWAQDSRQPSDPDAPNMQNAVSTPSPAPIVTVREKWNYFLRETASPLTFGGGSFNALFSQMTHTDPQYGVNGVALAKRFGASLADIATENFFGDFVTASLLHEDPRYFRLGEGHRFWQRVGYAISRAVVIRKDSGGNQFNFDNLIGSAASSAFSNVYYPPPSRTGKAYLMHFGIDVADYGFVNLAPEFWPDFRRKVFGSIH